MFVSGQFGLAVLARLPVRITGKRLSLAAASDAVEAEIKQSHHLMLEPNRRAVGHTIVGHDQSAAWEQLKILTSGIVMGDVPCGTESYPLKCWSQRSRLSRLQQTNFEELASRKMAALCCLNRSFVERTEKVKTGTKSRVYDILPIAFCGLCLAGIVWGIWFMVVFLFAMQHTTSLAMFEVGPLWLQAVAVIFYVLPVISIVGGVTVIYRSSWECWNYWLDMRDL